MELDNDLAFSALMGRSPANNNDKQDPAATTFADAMSAQSITEQNIAARDKAITSQSIPKKEYNTEDREFIREHGLQAYADKVKAEKIEELRKSLLVAMGLTEELLSAMPPEHRKVIEDMIDDTIEQRMAAFSIVNSDAPDKSLRYSDIDLTWGKVKNEIQLLLKSNPAGNTGAGAGMALLEIIEQIQVTSDTKIKDDYG